MIFEFLGEFEQGAVGGNEFTGFCTTRSWGISNAFSSFILTQKQKTATAQEVNDMRDTLAVRTDDNKLRGDKTCADKDYSSSGVSKVSEPDKVTETGLGADALRGFASTRLPSPDQGTGFQPPVKIDPRSNAQTARVIALRLIFLLLVIIIAQYVALIILTVYNRSDAVPNFEHLFNACFPVLAGLVGSAVTYYLTKGKK